ncbi:MAG: hypothetical protein ACI8PT_000061 [Gammaproteobacteria bacterium]|jgi:hypothetical protein
MLSAESCGPNVTESLPTRDSVVTVGIWHYRPTLGARGNSTKQWNAHKNSDLYDCSVSHQGLPETPFPVLRTLRPILESPPVQNLMRFIVIRPTVRTQDPLRAQDADSGLGWRAGAAVVMEQPATLD